MGLFPTDDPDYSAVYAEESAMVDASEIIAEALEASGMSQAALARALGVARSEITERLRGNRNITVRNLAATLHALGATLELSVALPELQHERASIDIGAYRKWAPPVERQSHDHFAPATEGYAMSGHR